VANSSRDTTAKDFAIERLEFARTASRQKVHR
jgi:hypothetical protein